MESRRRKRFLSQEEVQLWSHVTRRDTPLARLRTRDLRDAPPQDTTKAQLPGPETAKRPAALTDSPSPKPPKAVAATPPAPFDHRVARRIARGRREIDARLDLHGLRQQDAYSELRRFLAHAQAKGYRHVLIITGKGKPDPAAGRDFWTSEERGVLRRLVPHWLGEPPLRPYVVSYLESAINHGGSGALYVTVRKGQRAGHRDR